MIIHINPEEQAIDSKYKRFLDDQAAVLEQTKLDPYNYICLTC